MTNLTYGTPPDLRDCTDLGTVPGDVAPRHLKNEGAFGGDIGLHAAYGLQIPDIRRVWLTISYYRPKVREGEIPVPYRVKIPGLGDLAYNYDDSGENWRVTK